MNTDKSFFSLSVFSFKSKRSPEQNDTSARSAVNTTADEDNAARAPSEGSVGLESQNSSWWLNTIKSTKILVDRHLFYENDDMVAENNQVRSSRSVESSNLEEVETIINHIKDIEAWISKIYEITDNLAPPKGVFSKLLGSIRVENEPVIIPLDVVVTREFEESLQSLSKNIVYAGSKEEEETVNILVESVAKIKDLMKTIILIDDPKDRKRIMEYPIIKRVAICKYSILREDEKILFRTWISDLLTTRKTHIGHKVVDYLEYISNLSARDISLTEQSSTARVSVHDRNNFKATMSELYSTFNQFTGFVPSLLLLKQEELKRVSTTAVVEHILTWNLSRPFGVAVVFADLCCQITLLICVRQTVFSLVCRTVMIPEDCASDEVQRTYLVLSLIALLVVGYRFIADGVTMVSVSWKVFMIRFTDFWYLVEITSLWLVITGYSLSQNASYEVRALNVGFLWLNLLGFLKIINRSLATFVFAITKILRDILLFLGVTFILIAAFGDIFYILESTDKTYCLPDTGNPFCDVSNRGLSYLTVYRVLIGDFDYDDFGATKTSTFFFVVMTFISIIVLLNVLIALVLGSYEGSRSQAEKLYGKAKVVYVAKIIGFEHFLHPLSDKYASTFWRIFALLMKVAIFLCFLTAFIFLGWNGKKILVNEKGLSTGGSIFVTLIATILPTIILIYFSSFVITGWRRIGGAYVRHDIKWLNGIQNNKVLKYTFAVPIMFFTRLILGQLPGLGSLESKKEPMEDERKSIMIQKERDDEISSLKKVVEKSANDVNELKELLKKSEKRASANWKQEMKMMEQRLIEAIVSNATRTQQEEELAIVNATTHEEELAIVNVTQEEPQFGLNDSWQTNRGNQEINRDVTNENDNE